MKMEIASTSDNVIILSVKDLVVEYTIGGEVVRAVNGVSFDLRRGSTLGLVGETGAGKTTIAKAIMRILPNPPAKISEGEIFLDGINLLQSTEKDICKIRGEKVAMIFQDPMTALNPIMRIGKQISEALLLHHDISRKEGKYQAARILEMVGIPSARFNEYPHQFSGGMRQRVVIAISLACKPQVLLADEPTTALDVTIQAQILAMINNLKNEFNSSMLLISHDLGVVAEVSDEAAVLYAGEIVEYGSKKEIFTSPKHPYTIALFNAIPHLHYNLERLSPISGNQPNLLDLPLGCKFSPRCPNVTQQCRTELIKLIEIRPGHFCRCVNVNQQNDLYVCDN
jgi:peptide/nickel transport system ATP-binding protein